ncbi:hypothetical protein KP509_34G000200 [Ceratopteris richardii]|uniref:PPM-type phosphatase domain-containing protein n=1 Tax=Ceratopteris richardii TaxID=49495 RepID=A0A8T2QI61_CERRI|nr:hypothetical protein KP509_34G000200 [Ceratopteris richardii]
MEDEHILVDDLEEYLGPEALIATSGSYYGVFDGHDEKNAAQFVKEKLLNYIVSDVAFPIAVEEAVQHAYLETNAAFANACSLNNALSSGTTTITVLILAREIFVANVGDCRAVLCRRGKAIEMSRDHKPHVERSRIEALGGYIYDGYLNGYLSVARAFKNWHIEGLKGVNCPLIAEPEVRRACSHDLVDEALRRCSSDNLTVVTVCFQKSPPPRLFPRFMARRCMHFEKQL